MPGWHDATVDLQRKGKLQMVGIIQEQHPERCRLFMQWKKMDWPVLVDSLDQLEVSVVPITLAIDEQGVIRHRLRRPNVAWLEENFLNETYEPSKRGETPRTAPPDLKAFGETAETQQTGEAWRSYADALTVWAPPKMLDVSLGAYDRAILKLNKDGWARFRLGVAYRKRFDSEHRRPGDFQAAVDHWARALEMDPNNYIWRRRIQQYGPRLMKPYGFYDWVPRAREEIRAREEEPIKLIIEPGGAEFAQRARRFETTGEGRKEPDPAGKITRDKARLIKTAMTVVPPRIAPGRAVRVHVDFRPDDRSKAHWNNEAGESILWIKPPKGWQVDDPQHPLPRASAAVSREARRAEFEIRCPDDIEPGPVRIPAYALYYACEGETGKCLYRRQDMEIKLTVGK